MYFAKRFGAEGVGFVKAHSPGGIGVENPFDNDAVKVHVEIEQGAKAVVEGDCADAGRRTRTRAALAQNLLHRTYEDVQDSLVHQIVL